MTVLQKYYLSFFYTYCIYIPIYTNMSSTRLDYDSMYIDAERNQNTKYFAYQMHMNKNMNMTQHTHKLKHSTDLESQLRNLHQDNVHQVPGARDYKIDATTQQTINHPSLDRLMPSNTRMMARVEYEKKNKMKKKRKPPTPDPNVRPLNQHNMNLNAYVA